MMSNNGDNKKISGRTRALIVLPGLSPFNEMRRVAQLLKRSSRYDPVIILDNPECSFQREIEAFQEDGIEFFCARRKSNLGGRNEAPASPDKLSSDTNDMNVLRRFIRSRPLLKKVLLSAWRWLDTVRHSIWGGPLDYCLLSMEVSRAKDLYKRLKPRLIILPCGSKRMAVFSKAATACGIRSVVVPFASSTPMGGLRQTYLVPSRHVKGLGNRLISRLYPKWVAEYRGCRMLAGAASWILAVEWLGLSPTNPWCDRLGRADALAVESPQMGEIYERFGLDRAKLVMTGALGDNVLFENSRDPLSKREALYQEYGMPPGRPLILWSVTQDPGKHNFAGTEFNTYEEMLEFWVKALERLEGYNLAICPHPRGDREILRRFERVNMRIVNVSIYSLLPLSDFIVSALSSVFRAAIACGKPAIGYDMFKHGGSEYETEKGIVTVDTKNQLIKAMNRLVSDRAYYDELCAYQLIRSPQWGMLDGKVGERMLNFFDRMCSLC